MAVKGLGVCDSIKDMKIHDKNPFFLIMLNKVLIVISGNAKVNVKQQEVKDLAVVSYLNFLIKTTIKTWNTM